MAASGDLGIAAGPRTVPRSQRPPTPGRFLLIPRCPCRPVRCERGTVRGSFLVDSDHLAQKKSLVLGKLALSPSSVKSTMEDRPRRGEGHGEDLRSQNSMF